MYNNFTQPTESKKQKPQPKKNVKQRTSMNYEDELLNGFKKNNNNVKDLSDMIDPDDLSD